jgi:hypothetical protein
VLVSVWVCLGTGGSRIVGVRFPNIFAAVGLNINALQDHVQITIANSFGSRFAGNFSVAIDNLFSHVLVSIDSIAQRVHLYVNDAAVAMSSGGWTGFGPFSMVSPIQSQFAAIGAGSTTPGSGIGDLWATNTATFCDLSVTANRRKFINADLTPVDLGNDGSGPFGTQPPLFLTVRPGSSNPDDFLINNGSGGAWTTAPLSFETGLGCVAPPPPPPPTPPTSAGLAMDDVVCTIEAGLSRNLISLRWSDDRGHSFGNYVSQSMGEIGEYRTSLQWQRLAYARDRVFEISWSVPCGAALQGCWIDVTSAQS